MEDKAWCGGCLFWKADDDKQTGLCRRMPPQIKWVEGEPLGFWPITFCDEWCGEWKENTDAQPE